MIINSKAKILMITLIIFFSSALSYAVDEPSTTKEISSVPRQCEIKGCDGILQRREFISKEAVDTIRPVSGDGVNFFEFVKNDISEFFSGFDEFFTHNGSVSEVRSKGGDNYSNVHAINIYLIIPLLVFLYIKYILWLSDV